MSLMILCHSHLFKNEGERWGESDRWLCIYWFMDVKFRRYLQTVGEKYLILVVEENKIPLEI